MAVEKAWLAERELVAARAVVKYLDVKSKHAMGKLIKGQELFACLDVVRRMAEHESAIKSFDLGIDLNAGREAEHVLETLDAFGLCAEWYVDTAKAYVKCMAECDVRPVEQDALRRARTWANTDLTAKALAADNAARMAIDACNLAADMVGHLLLPT